MAMILKESVHTRAEQQRNSDTVMLSNNSM